MEEFIETVSNNSKRIQLENCMWQKGMYRKFKDKLIEIGLENEYYKFYDQKLKEIAIEWCKENNLEYEGQEQYMKLKEKELWLELYEIAEKIQKLEPWKCNIS